MSGIEERIAAVLRAELSLHDFDGDQLYEGAIDPGELAAAVVAELGLREEWTLYNLAGAQLPYGSRAAAEDRYQPKTGGNGPLAVRVVSGWEKA